MKVRSKGKTSKNDLSGKLLSSSEALSQMIGQKLPVRKRRRNAKKSTLRGLKGPWKHDFKNFCVKCNSSFHLQKHHITYQPALTVFLCEDCHKLVTSLNARGSWVAGGNKKTRTTYTNKIRVILWRWFLSSTWPEDEHGKPLKRLSKTLTRKILTDANFQFEEFSPTSWDTQRITGECLGRTRSKVGLGSSSQL